MNRYYKHVMRAESLTRDLTSFVSFSELVEASGHGYRPSLDCRCGRREELADLYDLEQMNRGSKVRAYRYGKTSRARTALNIARMARQAAQHEAKRYYAVVRSRGVDFITCDENGERIDHLCETGIRETQRRINQLMNVAKHSTDQPLTFYLQGGMDGADTVQEMAEWNYAPLVTEWDIEIG